LYYKQKEEKLYGNETSLTKEIQMKSVLEDMNFLASRADKTIKGNIVGSIVEAKVEVVKEYGVLCKLEDGKLTGFIKNENLGKEKLKPESKIRCVIFDIDTEKSIADLLPLKKASESKIKSKQYIGKDLTAKVISVKEGYSILSSVEHPEIICISYEDIGAHGDIIEGTITE
jgi:23S rRNA pseudoU1915 N3-methylase RlmH